MKGSAAAAIVAAATAAAETAGTIAAEQEQENDKDNDPTAGTAAKAVIVAHIEEPPMRYETLGSLTSLYVPVGEWC